MTRTIENRIQALEGQRRPDTGHEYEAIIPFGEPLGDPGAKYYRDGVEITGERYRAEAPKDQGIEIVLGEPIPKSERIGSPERDL